MTVSFRACPRCMGTLKTTRDMYGDYRECLQCGYMVDIEAQPKVPRQWLEEPRRRAGKKSQAA